MSLSATIDAMMAAGCNREQIAAVVKAHEAAREDAAAVRRAKDAARKKAARVRNVPRTDAESCGHDGIPQDGADAALSPKERSPTPPKEITPYPSSLRSECFAREADFDAVREAYPQRAGSDPRKPAWEKYQIAVRRGAAPAANLAGARAYAAFMANSDPRFVKQLAVWLNQECWTEDWASKPRDGPRGGEQSGRAFLASVALHGLHNPDDQPPDETRLLDVTPRAGRSGDGSDDHRALEPAGTRPYGGIFDL